MIELALDGVYRMEFEQIEPWARRALELARPLGDRPLTASAAAMLAWGAGLCGSDRRGGDVSLARPRSSSTRSRTRSWRSGSTAAINLAGAELYLDRFDETGVHAERVDRRRASDRPTGHRPLRLHAPGLGQDAARRACRRR